MPRRRKPLPKPQQARPPLGPPMGPPRHSPGIGPGRPPPAGPMMGMPGLGVPGGPPGPRPRRSLKGGKRREVTIKRPTDESQSRRRSSKAPGRWEPRKTDAVDDRPRGTRDDVPSAPGTTHAEKPRGYGVSDAQETERQAIAEEPVVPSNPIKVSPENPPVATAAKDAEERTELAEVETVEPIDEGTESPRRRRHRRKSHFPWGMVLGTSIVLGAIVGGGLWAWEHLGAIEQKRAARAAAIAAEEAEAAEATVDNADIGVVDLNPSQQIVQDYLAFGLGQRNELASLILQGRLTGGDMDVEFILLKKRPSRLRLEFEVENGHTVVVGCEQPDSVWQSVSRAGTTLEVKDATVDLRNKVRLLSNFEVLRTDRLIMEWRANPSQVEAAASGQVEIGGVRCNVLSLRTIRGETVLAAISQETGDVLQEQYVIEGQTVRVKYADYREVEAFRFPFKISHFRGNTLLDEMTFSRIAPNPGILNEIFVRPGVDVVDPANGAP